MKNGKDKLYRVSNEYQTGVYEKFQSEGTFYSTRNSQSSECAVYYEVVSFLGEWEYC